MPYEDPLEAALRALTDVEWVKRDGMLIARINKTHKAGIEAMLGDHGIAVTAEVSAARSGRYLAQVPVTESAKILKAVAVEKVEVKPHRRKWHSGK